MEKPPEGSATRPGLPARASVLQEKSLTPRRAGQGNLATASATARSYRILRTNEVDPYEPALTLTEAASFGAARLSTGNNFTGTARRAAKISIANAATETFDDLKDLIDDLPDHDDMVNHVPPITTARDSGRVAEEKRNVRLRAFLYAASREDDNDFHLIVGRDPGETPMYMTMEISGLPPSSSPHRARLKAARTAYKDFFGTDLPGASYDFYDPPIPIEVEGSLFFDMSHATGSRPGPSSHRDDMPVVWEVHPISDIVFEP
jgi:hypothetical protein